MKSLSSIHQKYFLIYLFGILSLLIGQCTGRHQQKFSKHVKKWTYPKDDILEPPEEWGGVCETGRRQSPIRLTNCQSKEFPFRPLVFKNYNLSYSFFSIHNSGRGVAMAVPKSLDATIKGGPLDDEYILENIHWHWNQTEHAMSDPGLIVEMHLVHRKKQYRSMREAMEHKDGLVIFGVLHKQATKSSKYLRKVLKNVENIEYPGDYSEITRRMAIVELLPSNVERYFTYFGSLTTPPCSESVTWIVFENYLNATLNDIEKFRQAKLSDGSILLQNFRPLKPLYERTVWINKQFR